jgi:hypothetical protein
LTWVVGEQRRKAAEYGAKENREPLVGYSEVIHMSEKSPTH